MNTPTVTAHVKATLVVDLSTSNLADAEELVTMLETAGRNFDDLDSTNVTLDIDHHIHTVHDNVPF